MMWSLISEWPEAERRGLADEASQKETNHHYYVVIIKSKMNMYTSYQPYRYLVPRPSQQIIDRHNYSSCNALGHHGHTSSHKVHNKSRYSSVCTW